jgi:hypothetical protein
MKPTKLTKLLFFILALLLTNCQVEEDTIQNQNKIQTLKMDEAIDYLNQNKANLTSKLSKKGAVKPALDRITQEKIINSDQLFDSNSGRNERER